MNAKPRRAFTLVEMLVVAGVMVTLFGLILSGSKPTVSSSIRATAQELASVLRAAQSRALGNPAGAGVLFELESSAALTVSLVSSANALPMVEGSVQIQTAANPIGSNGNTLGSWAYDAPFTSADLANGLLIRFRTTTTVGPLSQWFTFVSDSTGTWVRPRPNDGLTRGPSAGNGMNMSLPPLSTNLKFQVDRRPVKGEPLMQLRSSVVIDMSSSGLAYGDLAQFNGRGNIILTFDSAGAIGAVFASVGSIQRPVKPDGPVYFLVCSRASVDSGEQLTSGESLWVTVAPGGRVTVAANAPNTSIDRARESARNSVLLGR